MKSIGSGLARFGRRSELTPGQPIPIGDEAPTARSNATSERRFGFNGIRFSLHEFNTALDVERAIDAVQRELGA
jgi:hypothetical protein